MSLFAIPGGAFLADDLRQEFPDYVVEVREMDWGEWRASAMRLEMGERAIDSAYTDTAEQALSDLREKLRRQAKGRGLL